MNLKGILDIAGRSDTGRVRTQNEDSLGEDVQIGLVVLADGMGGYKGGEIASSMAVNTIVDQLRTTIPKMPPGEEDEETNYSRESLAVRESITKANENVYNAAQNQAQYHGMGTTLVMGVFYDNRITVAHIGDSRMYRFRNDQLEQITVDHTLLQELVDRGFYSPEEAKASLNKNLVTRALGIEHSVAIDVQELPIIPGDIYLLCSDGLNDMVDDDDITSILRLYEDNLDKKADHLINQANTKGGRDNISVLLARPNTSFPSNRSWHQKALDWLLTKK
ncbi:MAG: Stp1/IreP family PP2C-type Ser/Thr phosphatase [Gammaproteobacteria bacterium]|nr:Stp1/IreP family PP2C-type Ser/Thr phosphatase [Gammaproteobacteria bacterium]